MEKGEWRWHLSYLRQPPELALGTAGPNCSKEAYHKKAYGLFVCTGKAGPLSFFVASTLPLPVRQSAFPLPTTGAPPPLGHK